MIELYIDSGGGTWQKNRNSNGSVGYDFGWVTWVVGYGTLPRHQ